MLYLLLPKYDVHCVQILKHDLSIISKVLKLIFSKRNNIVKDRCMILIILYVLNNNLSIFNICYL